MINIAVYAASDWHASPLAWEQVKKFLQPDDTLYYLGDATDRGSGIDRDGGWYIMKSMLRDPQVIYLKGNHDQMLAEAILYPNDYRTYSLCCQNGGGDTLLAAAGDSAAQEVAKKLLSLPLYATYKRPNGKLIYMSHSGSTDIYNEHSLLWDRDEYLDRFKPEGYDYVIFGHTNPEHIIRDIISINNFLSPGKKRVVPSWEEGAFWVNEYRCCLDNCTIKTKQITLLDLDNFEEYIWNMPN